MQNLFNETASFTSDLLFDDTAIIGVLLAVSSYLFAALSFHKLKAEKSHGRFLSLSLEKRYGAISSNICILIGVASIILQASGLAWKLIEFRELSDSGTFGESTIHKICNTLPTASNIAISIGSGFVYLILWFRQRIFYVHPSLKILSNKIVKHISDSIIAVWLISYLILFVSHLSLVHYRYKVPVGCIVDETAHRSYSILVLVWLIVSILTQISLLFHFLYPIFKSSLWRNQQQYERNTSLFSRVKKAVALASICLATDILTIILRAILITRNSSIVLSIFTTNLVINHLMAIACFDHWKYLLWPWKFCLKNVSADVRQQKDIRVPTSNDVLAISKFIHNE